MDVARRHRGELVFVTYKHKARARRHGFEEGVKDVDIRHAYFVDDYGVGV
jgi:hypothetical protein